MFAGSVLAGGVVLAGSVVAGGAVLAGSVGGVAAASAMVEMEKN